jgi:uncharacterized protein YjbI with pentapeptide repeats
MTAVLPNVPPQRAAVRPRVFLTRGGAPRLLEEEVGELLAAQRTATVHLVGPHGSGRTTALQHLAACFADPMLRLDDGGRSLLGRPGARVLITAATAAARADGIMAWRLAPWTVDDCMEYLLARWPARVGEVLKAWQNEVETHDFLRWPGTCTAVLDAMARAESAASPFAALDAALASLLTEDERARLGDRLLRLFAGTSKDAAEVRAGLRPELASITAQTELAVARLLARLADAPDAMPALRWPQHFANAVGRRLRAAPALAERLLATVTAPASDQGNLLSALNTMQGGFRPRCHQLVNLRGARLCGADLRGFELSGAMQRIDLGDADLRGALLRHCPLDFAVLEGALLAGATLLGINAHRLAVSRLQAEGIIAEHGEFWSSDFTAANLDRARLRGVRLRNCNLQGARLRGADLFGAQCRGTDFAEADLRDADLSEASLEGLDLRRTLLQGAVLSRADLTGAHLEGLELAAPVAEGARFDKADLTATRWRGARLRGASLRAAGLAEIDWEDADLRDVDFAGATFHMGSSRSGLVDSEIASEGTRTGFYTDESLEQTFKSPEEVRKANLCGADLRGAKLVGVDFYLVDVRGAQLDEDQREWLMRCRAIVGPRGGKSDAPQS